jgi:hypothetical protein
MNKGTKAILSLTIIAMIASSIPSALSRGVRLPSVQISMQVYYPTLYCYYQVTLTNVPSGNDITNATYKGWCADTNAPFTTGVILAAYAYSSYDPDAPIPNGEWDKINYILNHKKYADQMEIQNAIWFFIENCHDDATLTPVSQALVDAANENGEGFIPTQGQILAVVLCPVKDYEDAIVEVRIPPDVVIPEYELGTIVGLIGFFAAFSVFRYRAKRSRLK